MAIQTCLFFKGYKPLLDINKLGWIIAIPWYIGLGLKYLKVSNGPAYFDKNKKSFVKFLEGAYHFRVQIKRTLLNVEVTRGAMT
jgi:hypothetical protein